MLGDNLFTWGSKKQIVESKSSIEAKFKTLLGGIDEVLWIREFFEELNILYEEPIKVLSNNKYAINIAHDLVN